MRTTLDIADDVLFAAKDFARRDGKTIGQVLSELARRALQMPHAAEPSALAQGTTAPTEPAETDETTEAPAQDEVLTVENNKDLARLLSDKNGDTDFWKEFFVKYHGRTFEFDGNIAYMTNTPGYEYTVDCLVEAGNYSETSSVGPPFRAPMINIHTGFKVEDSGDRSTLFQGDNIRIVAKLVDYNSVGQTFEIDIVSTKIR